MVQRFGALDSMRTMLGVLREVSLDEIREQAETPPRLLIVAPTADEARRLGLAVTGPEGQSATIFRAVDEPIDSVGHDRRRRRLGSRENRSWIARRRGAAVRVAPGSHRPLRRLGSR